MIRYEEIRGMPLVTTKEARFLGRVAQLWVDLKAGRVIGLIIDQDGENAADRASVLPFEQIKAFGEDAVMVSSKDHLRAGTDWLEGSEDVSKSEDLLYIDIVTKEGEHIGKIGSFAFDEKTGAITHYVTSENVYTDVMHGRGLLSSDGVSALSREALVVSATSAELADIMKAEQGLKQKTTAILEKTETGLKRTMEKVGGLVTK